MTDALYVGPARVLNTTEDGRARVQLLGGNCETTVADWAIPYRYEPRAGDILLVIGQPIRDIPARSQDGRYWVTGVVQGHGKSHLAFQGDTTVHSTGALRLQGEGGVRIDSPTVTLQTNDLECDATHVTQRSDAHDSSIRGTYEERSGASDRSIDEDDEQTAARHETVAQHVVKIDAELLRLS